MDGSVSMWYDEERKIKTEHYSAQPPKFVENTAEASIFITIISFIQFFDCFGSFQRHTFTNTHTHTHRPIQFRGKIFLFCRPRKIKTHTQPNEVFVFSLQIHMSELRLNIDFAHRINNTNSCNTYVIGSAFHRWLRANIYRYYYANSHFFSRVLFLYTHFSRICYFCLLLPLLCVVGYLCVCAWFIYFIAFVIVVVVVFESMPATFIMIFSWAVLALALYNNEYTHHETISHLDTENDEQEQKHLNYSVETTNVKNNNNYNSKNNNNKNRCNIHIASKDRRKK